MTKRNLRVSGRRRVRLAYEMASAQRWLMLGEPIEAADHLERAASIARGEPFA